MAITVPADIPRWRFAVLLWATGMVGVVVLAITALPRLLAEVPLAAPLGVLTLLSVGQSAVLLALAVFAGAALAPSVGLDAPAFAAAATGRPVARALAAQILPGLVAGVAGGLLLIVVGYYAPDALREAQEALGLPLVARVVYGGITEELLLRWGLMTGFVWFGWRFLQRRRGSVRPAYVWLAIALSALLFGAGHLPVATALVGSLSAPVAAFVVVANTAFGLLFGYLFWRYGLESAMIAHGLAHVVAYLSNLA